MALVRGFREIVISGRIEYEVEALSPLTIGSGREELNPLAPDIPLLRDSRGRPLIPGSTMKGFVRSGMERFLSGLGIPRFGAIVEDLMGTTKPQAYGSRLLFTDAPVSGEFTIGTREHVALNPSTMAVSHGPFKQEFVEPGARFEGSISFRNLPPSFLALLHPIAVLAEQGVFRMGHSKSRGYGHVRISFKDPLVTVPLPPEGGRASFTIRLNAMEKDVEVAVEKVNGGRISIRDKLSNCELVGKTVETGIFAGAEIPWDDLRECLQPLLEGLRR